MMLLRFRLLKMLLLIFTRRFSQQCVSTPRFQQTQTHLDIQLSGDGSDPILVAAQKLADILRQKKAFTNTSTFDLKCEVSEKYIFDNLYDIDGFAQNCGQGLVGEKGAREHAKETGHTTFGEY